MHDLNRPEPISALSAEELNSQGRYLEALAVAEHALQRNPNDTDARFASAFACMMLNRREEAQRELDCLLIKDPAYPHAAWMQAGLMRSLHGDHDPRILPAYDAALEADPANLYALSERADVLRAQGRHAEAQAIYAHICSPGCCDDEALRVEATFQLGCVALVLGAPHEAREAFKAVLAVAPDYPEALAMYELVAD